MSSMTFHTALYMPAAYHVCGALTHTFYVLVGTC